MSRNWECKHGGCLTWLIILLLLIVLDRLAECGSKLVLEMLLREAAK